MFSNKSFNFQFEYLLINDGEIHLRNKIQDSTDNEQILYTNSIKGKINNVLSLKSSKNQFPKSKSNNNG